METLDEATEATVIHRNGTYPQDVSAERFEAAVD
jgi:hypothetical protein